MPKIQQFPLARYGISVARKRKTHPRFWFDSMTRPGSRGGRRGRPKKDNSVGPTPETLAKKRLLIGDGDISSAESPIGVMNSRGFINPAEVAAAGLYERLYIFRNGKVHPKSRHESLLSMGVSLGSNWSWDKSHDLDREERLTVAWKDAIECLRQAGTHSMRVKSVIDDVVVHRKWPNWLGRRIASQEKVAKKDMEEALLRRGLSGLARHWNLTGTLKKK